MFSYTFNIAQYIINKMELFLSLDRKLKKSKMSPGEKKKRIDISSLNNTSTSTNRSTKTISNKRSSLSFRSSRLKNNERAFAQNANIDLKFSKIKNIEKNSSSTSLSPKEEERIINSLEEGIKLLPNGQYLIEATKILNLKIFTNDKEQSNFNSSTTMCSINTNGCKRISLPFKPKDKLSPIKKSICKSNSNSIMKEKKRKVSPKYANKTFSTYGTVDTNNNSKKSRNCNNLNIEKQKMIRMYFNHCTTINNRKGINI